MREDPNHPYPRSIAEAKVLPWIQDEAARLSLPDPDVQMGEDLPALRATLDAERERWIDQYGEGLIDKTKRDSRVRAVDDKLAELDALGQVITIEPIRWDRDPGLINETLRAIWYRVRLGPDLMPVKADWIIPAWRRA
jgi:hypothetical protein